MPESLPRSYPAEVVAHYLNTVGHVAVMVLDEGLKISGYNGTFSRLMTGGVDLSGLPVLEHLLLDSPGDHPFSDLLDGSSRRLTFVAADQTIFSLDCVVYRISSGYLVLGGQVLGGKDETVEKMTRMSNELLNVTRELSAKNRALEEARAQIKVLSGIVPICSFCKQIRDDAGYWSNLETFVSQHSEAMFSHGVCPTCMAEHYGKQ